MTRRTPAAISLACLLALDARRAPGANVTWAVDASGTWTAPANWSSNPALPGPADDVLIDRPAGLYTVTLPASQSIGSLLSQENLAVSNATLSVATSAQFAGSLTLSAATLSGGTWSSTSPADTRLIITDSYTSALNNVTLAGKITLALNDLFSVQNGLTLASGASVAITVPSGITFTGTQTVAGSGELVFNNATGNVILTSTGSLTLAPGISVRTASRGGSIFLGTAGLNQASLAASTPASLVVAGTTWTNAGALSASNGGSLTLNGAWTNTGTISLSAGSTVNLAGSFKPSSLGTLLTDGTPFFLTGTLNANTTPYTFSATSTPIALSGGTITGTITSTDDTPLPVRPVLGQSNLLSNVTLNAPLSLPTGVSLTASGAILNQPVSLPGGTLTLTGTWANNSSISANGGTLSLASAPPATLGTITLTNSTLSIAAAGYTTAILRPIDLASSTLRITGQGILDNANDTLLLPRPDALLFGSLGTLKGGTLAGPAGPNPITLSATGRFDGVTLASDLTLLPSVTLSILNNLTLDHAHLSLQSGADLRFLGPQTLGGTGTITFDGNPAININVNTSQGSFTLGPNITISANNASGFVSAVTNNGTITCQGPDTFLDVIGATNNGTIRASDRATLYMDPGVNNGTIIIDPTALLEFDAAIDSTYDIGRLQLAGSLLLRYGQNPTPTLNFVRSALTRGRAGLTGIIDPATAADPTQAIGYALATELLNFGTATSLPFNALTLTPSNVLLTATRFGDANLDGRLDADDYALLDKGFAQHGSTWASGDFNYDGIIDNQDYMLIDQTYLVTHTPSPTFLAQRESQFGAAYVSTLLASVPEPTSALACLFAMLPPLTRRRRPT